MQKRIGVAQVRVGMFIARFCGPWHQHPFWRSQMLLKSAEDLDLLRQSGIAEVIIDLTRGEDVAAEAAMPSPAAALPEAAPLRSAEQEAADTRADSLFSQPATPLRVELRRAAAVLAQSSAQVTSLFQEARLGKALDTAVVRQVTDQVAGSVIRHGGALISLVRLKTADDYTYLHSVAVCALMVALGRQIGLSEDECRAAGVAGLLHDIGKMDVPMDILRKPGTLTPAEWQAVREHPRLGHALLQRAGLDHPEALDVCLHHHEKVDGSGYPFGLRGDQISLVARMGAICDVYDAITSTRPYKAGWDPAESIRRMMSWTGHFDEALMHAFVKSLGIYPIGSLVRLSSGALAVVVEQSPGSLLKPRVRTIHFTRSGHHEASETIDLAEPGSELSITQREDPAKWRLPNLDEVWAGFPVARHQHTGPQAGPRLNT